MNRTQEEIDEVRHMSKSFRAYRVEAGHTAYSLAKQFSYIQAGNIYNIEEGGSVGILGLIRISRALDLEIVIKKGKITVHGREED